MASLRFSQAGLATVFPGHPFDLAQGRAFQPFFIQAHRIIVHFARPSRRAVWMENNPTAAIEEINGDRIIFLVADIHKDLSAWTGKQGRTQISKALLSLVEHAVCIPDRQKRAGGQAGNNTNTENNYNFSHYNINFGETIIKELQEII